MTGPIRRSLAPAALTAAALLGAFAASAGGLAAASPYSQRLIAFEKGGSRGPASVWVARLDGSHARRHGTGGQPLVSPDGTIVAADDFADPDQLILYSAFGGVRERVKLGSYATSLAFSPDSRYLLVALAGNGVKGTGGGLMVLDTSTGKRTVIVSGTIYGASFAPGSSDRIVYAKAASQAIRAPVNLEEIAVDGRQAARITSDGHSLWPVWGAKGIVFDRERYRGEQAAPAYQLWLMHDGHARQLTHQKVPALLDGLVPLQFSADGNRLVAEYEGEDTSWAYAVQLDPLKVRQVVIAGNGVQGHAISANGRSLLVDSGELFNPPNRGEVQTVPFGGGKARKLVAGAQPSWNG